MSDRVFVTLCGLIGVVILVPSLRAWRCNVRRFREARSLPPLAGLDLADAAIHQVRPPRRWPAVESVGDARVAAAYASLADDRVLMCVVGSEMLLVTGSGLMGIALTKLDRWWWALPVLGALVLTIGAAAVRLMGTRRWKPVRAAYREVHATLTGGSAPR
ncbi:MAG TPA: hypothetical protein VF519_00365 [Mycobacteriales bacterium]|jgi:hypothetical protein